MVSEAETSATIEAIYDAALDPTAWPQALRATQSLVGGTGAVLMHVEHESQDVPFFLVENLSEDRDGEYVHRLHRINPRVGLTFAEPPGVACWDYRLMGEREMDRHEFYDGIQKLSGVRYFVGMRPQSLDGRSLLTSIERTKTHGHFDPEEIALFSRVAPHIGNAFRLVANSAKLQTDAALLHLLDQRRSEAVFLLDRSGCLLDANGEGSRVLALDDGLRLAGGRLTPWKAADQRSLDLMIAEAIRTVAGEDLAGGGVMALPRPSGTLPLLLRVLPWPKGRLDPHRRPSVVVLLRDPERRLAENARVLARLLGLSGREAALTCRLAGGQSLRECAEALGIRYGTARVHLRNIFEKTGARTQRDLQRLVQAVP